MFNRDLYIPKAYRIKDIKKLTPDIKLFSVALTDGEDYRPGQFVQLSLLGYGEVPISIASSPTQKGCLELLVRNVGSVTNAIHALKPKDEIGIRGPYGSYFPIDEMRGCDFIFVSGGCGLAPLRSAIRYIFDNKTNYGNITILYGARTKEDIVFKNEIDSWKAKSSCRVYLSVEHGSIHSEYKRGVVTALFDKLKDIGEQKIFICGPPVMTHYAIEGLLARGASGDNIFVTLERYMKCGVGKCGHCYIGDRYVCIDGPVFSYREMCRLSTRG